jgi:hypothetical protein
VLIIGSGNQGALADAPKSGNEHKIISFAHALKTHEGFETITFYDKDKLKSKTAAETWDCYYTECDIDYICEYGDIDIAVITTPDENHYEILKQLAECPIKLIVCEKPICSDLQQAREIVELYKQKNIPILVNYTRRFLPHYDYLKQYGKPVYATCSFNRGFLHSGSHAVDFFNMIGADNYRLIEIPTEAYRVWDLNVYYENHAFSEVRVGDMPVWEYYDKSHWHVVENAFNFLEGKEELKCTADDALKGLEICYELMEGAK